MEPVDTLVCARWVLPVEPDGTVLADHAVAMRAGRIVAVLPTAAARATYAPAELVERPQHAVLPGLVNAHTHAAMTLLRGRAENLPLAPWLQDAIAPIERRWVDPEYVRDGTELAIAEMLRGGVTCFADMQLWPEVVARTAADAHMRVSVGLVVEQAASRWAADPDEYIEKGMALRDDYRGDALVATHFALEPSHALDDATLCACDGSPTSSRFRWPCPCTSRPGKWRRAWPATGPGRWTGLLRLGLPARCWSRCMARNWSPADIDALRPAAPPSCIAPNRT